MMYRAYPFQSRIYTRPDETDTFFPQSKFNGLRPRVYRGFFRQLCREHVRLPQSYKLHRVVGFVPIAPAALLLKGTALRVSQIRHTARFTSNAGDYGGPITGDCLRNTHGPKD